MLTALVAKLIELPELLTGGGSTAGDAVVAAVTYVASMTAHFTFDGRDSTALLDS